MKGVWPQTHSKRLTEINASENLFALRMVFILYDSFSMFKVAPVSVDNLELYNNWIDCKGNIDEALFQVSIYLSN